VVEWALLVVVLGVVQAKFEKYLVHTDTCGAGFRAACFSDSIFAIFSRIVVIAPSPPTKSG